MSSTAIPKASPQTNQAGPGLGIYLAFIPWIVFSIVAEHSTPQLAAVDVVCFPPCSSKPPG